ncbi:MAG TPA: cupin domain-containing protein [Gaiellaceae bacterium]|jgi:quercetin dioxygenase-like cupin family protein|nr:cupin domain-containing protein [Gaiellaceae bacterium]
MKLALVALVLVAGLAAAASSFGGGVPITAQALALGKMQATQIHAQTGSVVLDRITIQPGGNFGWHTHPAPVAVVVTRGTVTVFDPAVDGCKPFHASQGQSFVEPANHVHLARNDGSTPVTLYAMYLGLPKAQQANVAVARPAGCSS